MVDGGGSKVYSLGPVIMVFDVWCILYDDDGVWRMVYVQDGEQSQPTPPNPKPEPRSLNIFTPNH